MNRNAIAAAAGSVALAFATGTALAADVTAGTASRMDHTDLSLSQLQDRLAPVARSREFELVPNQFQTPLSTASRGVEADFVDPLLAPPNPVLSPTPGVTFDGYSNSDNVQTVGGSVAPPDTNGDVGLDNVVTYVNLGWSVYDKAGGLVAGPFAGNTFWAGFGGACEVNNNGDPIVIYDSSEGRWVFTQFAPFSGVQCFAISDGEDPTQGFTRYEFVVEPAAFNDYPKVGVWRTADGSQSAYTYTGRNFIPQSNPGAARDITAVLFDRDAMLAGDPAAGFTTAVMPGGFQTYDGAQPGSVEAGFDAPAGACPLFTVAEGLSNSYRFFEFCESFPGAGTFSALPTLSVPAFDDGLGNVQQPRPGSSLDTLAFFTMYRANHAIIDGEHRLVVAHTVDAGSDRAGMRWAILNVDDYNNIALADTGTYAPNDGLERWMGSAALDKVGNLGLGYTRGGGGQFTSVYFTGRETTDPAGTLQSEVACVNGSGVQTGTSRWGDYSATVLDPADQCTMWTFQEYVAATGQFSWNTRVCAFSFPSCTGGEPTVFTLLPAVPGVAGQVNDFTTENGSASSFAVVYFGRGTGSTSVSVGNCSVTIDLQGARLLGFAQDSDGDGSVTVSPNIPSQVAGRTFSFQALDLGTCDTSNVTTETF